MWAETWLPRMYAIWLRLFEFAGDAGPHCFRGICVIFN
jgi:hypothetical protein